MAQLWRAQNSGGAAIWGPVNGSGTGVAGPAVTSVTAAATSVVVAWTGTATHYRINGGAAVAMPDGTSPDTITGLSANTEYTTPGLQLSGDGGSTWSVAVAFGTTNPGTGGGAIGTEHALQGSASAAGIVGASAAMAYSPPGALIYSLQAAPGGVAVAGQSAVMGYTGPADSPLPRPTAKPDGLRLSTALRQ